MESRIPSEAECLELLSRLNLPSGVINHSIAVKNVALQFADVVESRGKTVNRPLVTAAALLHDIKKVDAHICHGIEGGEFLRQLGFREVAAIVEKHCLNNLDEPSLVPRSTEDKLLMYSDLKVNGGHIVSLEDRFSYIKEHYRPKDVTKFRECIIFAKQIEYELLGRIEKK